MLLDTTIDNWHPCTERQAIYNIHSINSSNEIIHFTRISAPSVGAIIYPTLSLCFLLLYVVYGLFGDVMVRRQKTHDGSA